LSGRRRRRKGIKSLIELFSFLLEAVFLTISNQDDMIIEDYGWIIFFVGCWEN